MPSVRPITKFLAEKAAVEINETPERIPNDIQAIREWLKKQPHLISRTDDQFLLTFLRGTKYRLENCKEKLDSYHTLRTAFFEFFSDRDPNHEDFIGMYNRGMTCPLPVPHPGGQRVIFVKPGSFDAQKNTMTDFIKFSLMVVHRNCFEDDHLIVCGCILFIDMKGFTVSQIAQITIPLLKKIAGLLRAYPVRQKGFHFINFPSGFDTLVTITLSLFPEKVAKQFYIHSDLKSVYKYIPPSCLPVEYGGDAGYLSEILTSFKDKYLPNEKWFLEDAKYKSDESKRSDPLDTVNSLFGTNGSFRKLDID